MDENSINTLLTQTNMNEGAESGIIDFEGRKQNIDMKKRDLEQLLTQFEYRKEQLFHYIEEFSKTKNNFIRKSNLYFEDHQKKIINLKDDIKLLKEELDNKEKDKQKLIEKIQLTTLSIETQNFKIRKLERKEKEIDEQMILFQKTIKNGDNIDFQTQMKKQKMKQIQKLIKSADVSIEKYENMILNYELQISELKLKNNENYEKQTDIIERKNAIFAKDNFDFLATKEKINQMKIIESSKSNTDFNKTQLVEIDKNKAKTKQKIFISTNQAKTINERLILIKEEIQCKIKEIQNVKKLTEKPNNAIQKLRSSRNKRENLIKYKKDQLNQQRSKIERKKNLYQKKISQLKEIELELNSEIQKIDHYILNEDILEKEISLRNDILIKENDIYRKNEVIQTNESIKILDQPQRKIELQKSQYLQDSNDQSKFFKNTSKLNLSKNCSNKSQNAIDTKNNSKSLKKTSNENKKNSKINAKSSKLINNCNENSSKALNDKNIVQLKSNQVRFFPKTSKNSEMGTSLQFKNSDINKKLETQILQAKKELDELKIKYSKEKQNYLKLQIQFQILQINKESSEDEKIYKEIEKKIGDSRLLFLHRIMEISEANKEIELKIQKKLEKIESIKNKLHNLKNEEISKDNLIVAYSPADEKLLAYPIDSVSRHEKINWLYLMINKEKDEWIKYHSNGTIKGLLNVWNGILDRM